MIELGTLGIAVLVLVIAGLIFGLVMASLEIFKTIKRG